MSSIIQLLPDHNQIAAGELYKDQLRLSKNYLKMRLMQRQPILKVIKDAGKALVQVIDNGLGMSVTDARLCFERRDQKYVRLRIFSLHTKVSWGSIPSAAIAVEMKTARPRRIRNALLLKEVSIPRRRYCRKALHLRSKSVFQYSSTS
jgi:DNA mismatch repair protein MutL